MQEASLKPKRIFRSSAQWRKILAEYENSHLTQTAFCQEKGIALSNFSRWRKKLALHGEPPQEVSSPFVELTGASSVQSEHRHSAPASHDNIQRWQIELDLGHGHVLRIRTV